MKPKIKVKIRKEKESIAVPGKPMTEQAFHAVIEKAEKGPFFPIAELEKYIQKWKEKYAK